MTIHRTVPNKAITEHEYMRLVQQAIIRLRTHQKKEEEYIDKLSAKIIKRYAPYQAGVAIEIPPRLTPPQQDMLMPYTFFSIETVFPEIDWKEKKIVWKYIGEFSNAEKTEKGHIYHHDLLSPPKL